MKFIHIADLHLGKQLGGFSLLEDQRLVLQRVLDLAQRKNADALLLAGDLYDKTTPSAEATALLDWFLTQAARRSLPVVAVPGNHDAAERVGYAAAMLARNGIHVPAAFSGRLERVELHDAAGPVDIWMLPFVKPAHVRPFFPEADIGQDYTAAVRAIVSAAPIDASRRNVLVAHQFVTAGAGKPEQGGSELSVGGLDNVDASAFAPFDYVALGHIHRAQKIGRKTIRYAGSPLKYAVAEAASCKSATVVEMGPKNPGDAVGDCVSFSLEALEATRDLRRIAGPLAQLTSNDVVSQQNAEDYLHVVLTDEQPPIDAIARIRSVYPNVVALSYDNARTRHASDLGARRNAGDFDPVALFARFFSEQNGSDLTEAQGALARQALEAAREEEGALS